MWGLDSYECTIIRRNDHKIFSDFTIVLRRTGTA
jgi:hypothetical protein